MNEELDALEIVTRRLNKEKISYMVSGSMAVNYYAIPRMTRDIDIIIELSSADIDKFANLFENDFYVDKEMIKKEVLKQGMFNVIHSKLVVKIDFIIKKPSPYHETAFSRKKEGLVKNNPIWFSSPEDLIISKLNWSKDSHSEMQIRDVRNLMNSVDNLDFKYIENWISQLGLEEIYKEAKR